MINYTVRLLIWKHKKDAQSRCPIVIALTINRKKNYFTTPHKIPERYWDDKIKQVSNKYSNSKIINADLNKRLAEVEHAVLAKTIAGKPVDGTLLKREIKGGSSHHNFFEYASDLKKDKDMAQAKGSRKNYSKEMNRLQSFAGSGLSIGSIDVQFLRKYEAHERNRGMFQNTLNTSFKWLRTVITHAAKEKIILENPFDDFTIPKYVQTDRVFLEKAERQAWVDFWKQGKVDGSLYATLTYFLMGIFSGLRHSDWDRALSMVSGDLLRLRPIKTQKSGQWVVLPIGKTLAEILEVVKTLPRPISARKTCDHLKILSVMIGSTKNITTHVARHSFGTMCAENKIPKSVTAELMAVTVDTVDVYYHLTGQNISDQAAVLRGL